ncbi:MAG TPA: Ig-like domain-containing protein [Chitinophagaceae bacterium]
MKNLSFIGAALVLVSVFFTSITGPGCAVVMNPSGGRRDSLPPVLLKASPNDSTNNFTSNHITLTFDEFVQLQDIQKELIVSPIPKRQPEVEARLRTIYIRIRDTLQPNTTYTFNFGKSIRDVNEGNIFKNYSYLFATGPTFDSLTLSGRVILAENGRPDSTLVVILHTSGEDSAVFNARPLYLATLDSSGRFNFRNLPAGTFYVYALEDQGGAHRYLSEQQKFAFADSPVVLENRPGPVTLFAYSRKKQAAVAAPTTSRLPSPIGPKPKPGNANSENRLRLQTNIQNGQLDLLGNLTVSSEKPLRKLDTTRIHFSTDTTYTPVTDFSLLRDTSNSVLTFQYKWKENTLYHVVLEKEFAEDTSGRQLLKADTITFTTKKLSDYGSLKIRFRNYDQAVNPVLLFIQNDQVTKSIPLNSAVLDQQIFPPGDYEMRLLHDRNGNGKWDPGDFFGKHLQPEIVVPVSRKITVKPNWENDFDIAL